MRQANTARVRAEALAQRRSRLLRIGLMGLVLAGGAWFVARAEAAAWAGSCMGLG